MIAAPIYNKLSSPPSEPDEAVRLRRGVATARSILYSAANSSV
jgi:hypothetical protein